MELILTSNNVNIDITPSNIINTEIIAPSAIDLTFTDVGVQGLRGVPGVPGDKGENLQFDDLTEQQKMELRGDVGPTSTNYTNIFYDSLLS